MNANKVIPEKFVVVEEIQDNIRYVRMTVRPITALQNARL